ncbi:MAG: alpha/beta hydrolase [Alphaproteobacteria bacterium]|jgi:dienelactone hydrolase|nr:alpha/beta hydrolase [Alphaproteobacteria bacterium]
MSVETQERRTAALPEPKPVTIPPVGLEGLLAVPKDARGVIVFAHGSGSSRLSPRNTHVAEGLQAAGFATLLFDLLTEAEGADRANVFDIALLGERLALATAWLADVEAVRGMPVGLFGASTGAAAALVAAARADTSVGAVVSRGGRPDLAGSALQDVSAPTLFIVGGNDTAVLDLNRQALAAMTGAHDLRVIPGATHLFEEPGTLDAVIAEARKWFAEKLI